MIVYLSIEMRTYLLNGLNFIRSNITFVKMIYNPINAMSKLLIILLSVLYLASATVIPRTGPIEAYAPLTFKVQLDDSPLVRWAPIIKAYNHNLNRFV